MKKIVSIAIALLLSVQLMAQSELKTKSISVFKNGKSFVTKEGNVSTDNSVYTLQEVPDALFGTLWFVGLQSNVTEVTGRLEQIEESMERKAHDFKDLLYANKGAEITLTTLDNNIYEGVVEDFDLTDNPERQVLLIKTGGKWVSIQLSAIKSVEFSSLPQKSVKWNTKTGKPTIQVKFAKGGSQPLRMMYLQNGFSWTPTYLLELASDTEANLRLQAEVINEVEDVVNTSIDFVVGVPNFKFADRMATLTSFLERRNQDYLDAGYRQMNVFSNSIIESQMGSNSYSEELIIDEDSPANVNTAEDYYFYQINNVTLKKGMRAYYSLFSSPIRIRHLYECNLSETKEDRRNSNSYNSGHSFDAKQSQVFHVLEIRNDTNTPFTTGSVMIVDGKTQRPLAEDLVKYTGIGQTSSIQLTRSPDIRVEEKEKIVQSREKAEQRNGYNYTLVTIESEVVVINSKKKDVDMSIHKDIAGKSITATIEYDSKQMPSSGNNYDINPQDQLRFNLNVKGGQTKKFTYTYEMYVRN